MAAPRLSTHQLAALARHLGLCEAYARLIFKCPASCCDSPSCAMVTTADLGDGLGAMACWRCSECSATGDAAAMVEQVRRCSPEAAVEELVDLLHRGLSFFPLGPAEAAEWVFVVVGYEDSLALYEASLEEPLGVVVGFPDPETLALLPEILPPVRAAGVGAGSGRRYIFCLPNPRGDPHNKIRLAFDRLGKEMVPKAARVEAWKPPKAHPNFSSWRAEGPIRLKIPEAKLSVHPAVSKQPIRKSYASLITILETPTTAVAALGNRVLEFNEMLGTPVLDREPVTDNDYGLVRCNIERWVKSAFTDKPIEFGKSDIADAVRQVGMYKRYHPVREYVLGNKWDGERRMHRVAEEVLHVLHPENPLVHMLLKKWFLAAMARALAPGCKVDSALILVSEQYSGKSTFFKNLVPDPDWFSETDIDLSNKDALQAIGRVWLWEWAELSTMNKKDAETVKNFLSRTADLYRRPYDRQPTNQKRCCVIVGTTNTHQFLVDPTGNRRSWPIEVGSQLNLDLLLSWRDQLWAEAYAELEAAGGVKSNCWKLSHEENRALHFYNQQFEKLDPWEHILSDALVGDSRTSVSEVLENLLDKKKGQWVHYDEIRVAGLLQKLGFRRVQVRQGEARSYQYIREGEGGQVGLFDGVRK